MQVLDLIGIFAFAVSGALMANRRDFDLVGDRDPGRESRYQP